MLASSLSGEMYHHHRGNASELPAKKIRIPSDEFAHPCRYTLFSVAEVPAEMLAQEMIGKPVAFRQVPGDTAFGEDF